MIENHWRRKNKLIESQQMGNQQKGRQYQLNKNQWVSQNLHKRLKSPERKKWTMLKIDILVTSPIIHQDQEEDIINKMIIMEFLM